MWSNFSKREFQFAFVIIETLLFIVVLPLLLTWLIYYRGGFHWSSVLIKETEEQFFNIHPLCMVLAFILCLSQGVLIYRIVPGRKIIAKIAHTFLHAVTASLAILGVIVVWKYHSAKGSSQVYTLHGWVGLCTLVLFCFQFVFGFVFFIGDRILGFKKTIMPVHRFLGLTVLASSCVACVSGIDMKLAAGMGQFDSHVATSNGSVRNATYGDKPPEAMVANFLGLFIWFAVIAVVFVATRPAFQRQDISEGSSESDPMLG